MTARRFRAARLFTGRTFQEPGELLVADGQVVSAGPPGSDRPPGRAEKATASPPPAETIDLGEVTLCPGLVDVHNHGGGGVSFAEDPGAALAMHRAAGSTSIVASLVSAAIDDLESQIKTLRPLVHAGELAGIHLEGPWLSERYRGAHAGNRLRDPVRADVDRLLDAGKGAVAMVTLAVERDGALETVRHLRSRQVVAALGHSGCTYEQAVTAIDAGATGATHLFNAMPGLHHRSPGPVLAVLGDARVWSELIVDNVHVDPVVVAWIMRVSDRVVLITDAMAAAGCPDGRFQLGELPVTVSGGVARIAGTDTIAGSTLTLAGAVRNAIGAGVPADVALRAATYAPARYLGLQDVGELVPGAWADLVAFDSDWQVRRVVRRGVLI